MLRLVTRQVRIFFFLVISNKKIFLTYSCGENEAEIVTGQDFLIRLMNFVWMLKSQIFELPFARASPGDREGHGSLLPKRDCGSKSLFFKK